jgi:hypothetical protein
MIRKISALFLAMLMLATLVGCNRSTLGGAAVGALGTGAAYEYQNKRQMDQLEEDFEQGKIDKQEYEIRKKQIESGSLVY